MPLSGYVCPAGSPVNETQRPGQHNSIEHCLGTCRFPCVSPPLLAAMWQSEIGNHHKGNYLSASSLASDNCARQTWFERQPEYPYYEIPRRRFWPFRGTVIHGLVEGAGDLVAPFGWMQELRMAVPLVYPDYAAPVFDEEGRWTGDWDSTEPLTIVLGGTTDTYNPYSLTLHDFKTLSDDKLPAWFEEKHGGQYSSFIKDPWVLQTNIYAWLVSKTRITDEHREAFRRYGLPELEGEFFPRPTNLEMQLITMMEIPLTGREYVPRWRGAASVAITSVPLLAPEDIEAFIRDRALDWFRWLSLGEKPPVVPRSKKWMCVNCPFNGELIPGGPCFPSEER